MKKYCLWVLAVFSLGSCDRFDVPASSSSYGSGGEWEEVPVEHEMIVLGEKLENPYTVDNMTRALASLYPSKASSGAVSTTDLYVRFLPKGEAEYRLLEDLGVELIDHPVDYEIVREGDYFRDPDIPDDEITWQYAIVPPDFEFPETVRYELIDRCFISEHDVITRADGIDWAEVEKESYRLTGNGKMLSEGTRGGTRPAGRITVVDDKFPGTDVGVKGVRVSCNQFVKFASAYTDENGYYKMSRSFSGEPRYRLVFKNRKGFSIGFNLVLIQGSISTLGRGSKEGKSVKIDRSTGKTVFSRCVVNNAGYDYYESCRVDDSRIKTPPANLRIWIFRFLEVGSAPMLQQGAAIDGGLLSKYLGDYIDLLKMFLPDVTIGVEGRNSYADIYSETVHELAHASHYMQVGNEYWRNLINYTLKSFFLAGFDPYGSGTDEDHGYCEVGESWAYYVQTRLYRDRYPSEAASFGTSYWFSPQIFFYLDERGLTRFQIYKALTSDVHDRETLQAKLLSLYPEFKIVINQAFDRYI